MYGFKLVINDQYNDASMTNLADFSWELVSEKQENGRTESVYYQAEENLEVTVCRETILGVTRQKNRIKNCGNKMVKLNRFSSAYLEDVGAFSVESRTKVRFCRSSWQGEGQWQERSLAELGIYPVARHTMSKQSFTLSSTGSWSTSKYYPVLVLETPDQTWIFEHEGGFNWEIELGIIGGGVRENSHLAVDINSADETHDAFSYFLEPGDTYEASPAIYARVQGSFEDAAWAMLKFKRTQLGHPLKKLPVCFNDYMNCLWANPSDRKLIPLIDAAAEVGAEVFCIDDGWFLRNKDGYDFGDWVWNDDRFGSYGFAGIIGYIKKKGMIPGIWLEIDTCSGLAKIAKKENALLTRNGNFICGRTLNFSNPEIQNTIFAAIERLYQLGIRYIKNDYNHTIGIGCDNSGQSFSYGLRQNVYAFYQLIERVHQAFPDMILENCASGAMRCDHGTLRHFQLQSVSDQEQYFWNPSIIKGMLANIPTSQLGIWAYPMPLPFDERERSEQYFANYQPKDEETIFNMVNGMFGIMYLSGRIDRADAPTKAIIREGIALYKQYRDEIAEAVPLFLEGMFPIHDNGCHTIDLWNEEKNRMFLGVYHLHSREEACVDLEKWIKEREPIIRNVYPAKTKNFSIHEHCLMVSGEQAISARFFVIDF